MSEFSISAEQLARFDAFSGLPETDRLILAGQIGLRSAKRGQPLFQRGDIDAVDYFLVSGRVRLIAEDGRERTVEGGSAAARMPLARLRPRQYRAITETDIEFFCVDCDLLDAVAERSRQDRSMSVDFGIADTVAEDEAEQLLDSFQRDLAAGRFHLQTLPEVALEMRRVLDDPAVGPAEVSAVLNRDPVVAAKIVRAANSPLYFGVSKCETMRDAVVRLGLATTRQLVLGFALRELFQSRSTALHQRLQACWQHSVEVAAISFVLARHTRTAPPEEALLAGLVSDIGTWAMLCYTDQYPQVAADSESESLIERLRGPVGALVLEQWQFPAELVEVARSSRDWLRSGGPRADLCDLVLAAHLHALIGKRVRPAPPPLDDVPAFSRLRLGGMTPAATLAILKEARSQVDELRELLVS